MLIMEVKVIAARAALCSDSLSGRPHVGSRLVGFELDAYRLCHLLQLLKAALPGIFCFILDLEKGNIAQPTLGCALKLCRYVDKTPENMCTLHKKTYINGFVKRN